jgi:hypothetical protein
LVIAHIRNCGRLCPESLRRRRRPT